MTVRPVLCAILLAAATGVAHADGSANGSGAPAATKKIPDEEPVSPTGLIIAGVALAAFAVLLLVGRRKKPASDQPRGELAEVRLVIETDERAMVWTQPSFKLPTDRLGEVVLHLPVGSHDVHVQIGGETFVRTIQVPAIRKMRLPINFAKERISRAAASGEVAAASPAASRTTSAQMAGFERSASTTKPPTSMARAYPDASTQGQLGAQLAGLIDVELDAPKAEKPAPLPLDTGLDPGPGAIDFSPQRAPSTTKPPLALDFSTPEAPSLELDDLEIPVVPDVPVATPVLPPQPVRSSPLAGSSPLPPPPARTSPLRDVVAPANPQRSALGDAGPSRGRPPTSPLEGIRSQERPKQPTLPPRQNLDISLDDIAPVQTSPLPMRTKAPSAIDLVPPPPARSVEPVRGPIGTPPRPSKAEVQKAASAVADFALDELPQRAPAVEPLTITAPELDLAPPEHSAQRRQASTDLDVGDFALDNFSQPVAAQPVAELPKVTAASVMDLTLDDGDLPVQRIPAARTQPAKPTPDISDFEIENTPPPQAPRPAADDRPVRPTPVPRPSTPKPIGVPASIPAAVGAIANRYRKTGAAAVSGPLGALFRGRDENAGRDVWIEEVPRDVTLTVPAAMLAKLDHPNVLKFYEHVVDPTKAYVVTELIEGKSLDQQLVDRGGSLVLLEAIGIVDQVCAALAYAHDRGVFHRNVRPACVWISGRTVKLAGFGMSVGRSTPYQAPELAAGTAPGIRTDLYSVGVTLVQLLTGAVPSPGKIELPADVPRTLASLIRKLVSLEPMMRPANIKAVRDAFSSVF